MANPTMFTRRPTPDFFSLAINLDGLVASSERRVEYKEPNERRVARTFEVPEIKGRGAYVVELIGNGKSSRALVQKGRLGILQDVTAAGQEFTVLDEANRRLTDVRAWLEANWHEIFSGGPAREQAIAVSCRSKATIVARDERETGDRALLNLGHTFGHALEAQSFGQTGEDQAFAPGANERKLHRGTAAIDDQDGGPGTG